MKGLILAAGEGSRLRPLTFSVPKHLIPFLGKAMIEYPVDQLFEAGIRDIGVVVGYFGEMIESYLKGRRRDINFEFAIQEKRLGIAHAINLYIEKFSVDGELVVYLGDNLLKGGISKYVKRFKESSEDALILLSRVKDPTRFGVAEIKDGKVVRLIEKPKVPPSDLAVIGVYFFRNTELVKRAFSTLKPSWRGEYEITDLIQWFIDKGYTVGFERVEGWWKDVGTPESLLDATYQLLDEASERIEGEVVGEIRNRAIVEKSARVEGTVYGPAYIGEGVHIEKDAVIEPYTSIERGTHIVSGAIARSLVLTNNFIDAGRARLVESIIGNSSKVLCKRYTNGDIKLRVSDMSYIEL